MKRLLLLFYFVIANFVFAQTNEELKKEIDDIKISIRNLKQDIDAVRTENVYLKTTLNINEAILEQEQNNSLYKITKVVGNKAEKTVLISFLVESKDVNKELYISDLSIIDLEGNEYKVDLFKSSSPFPKLVLNVPMKLNFSFKNIENESQFLKLFRFQTKSKKQGEREELINNFEFKDLKVNWE